MPLYPNSVTSRLGHALYNLDRMICSLLWPSSQETISSELARRRGHWWADAPCAVLDWLDPGHCDSAIAHADKLTAADDGIYK